VAFEITITRDFFASHQLRLHDGTLEPLHGHNWRVAITVSAERLDQIGVVMDFHELERLLDAIVSPMHNRHLNDVPAFASRNPSAENVALHVAETLRLPGLIKLRCVEVWETTDCRATWRATTSADH
jgi:6-pyruvoyltetrahydropterin/6-carboxytetrahydropterin synthase